MLQRNLKRLPVVDADGVLVGILARVDVFRAISRTSPDWSGLRARQIDVTNLRYVRDVMRRDTHTVGPDAPGRGGHPHHRHQRHPAGGRGRRGGRLLGLISDRDVLAAFGDLREGLWQHLVSRLSPAGTTRRQAADPWPARPPRR